MVDYFTMTDVPGKMYFRCDRMRASLSTEACSSMWRKADELNDGSHNACRLCPIGAVHAGEVAASMSPLKGSMTCARCHRGAGRLIGGMHCVSCYNRQREYLVGRNGRGKAPVKIGRLDARVVRYVAGDAVKAMRMPLSTDIDELVVAVLRDSRQAVIFAFNNAPPPGMRQARLW